MIKTRIVAFAPSKTETHFACVLHRMLNEAEANGNDSIVGWNGDGLSFKVHDREKLMTEILPRYFQLTKYKSFARQLNLWNFYLIGGTKDGSCK